MTGKYEWPVPEDADVLEALLGVSGDVERGLPPKHEEFMIILACCLSAERRQTR